MKYIIDELPGSEQIVQSLRDVDNLLGRYQEFKIVFSYASEDWRFVEKVSEALKVFFPEPDAFTVDTGNTQRHLPNAFCYTKEGEPYCWTESDESEGSSSFIKRNEVAASKCYDQLLESANVFVLFAYKKLIKSGPVNAAGLGRWQEGELQAWNKINDPANKRTQYMVDFEGAYADLVERRSPDWGSAEISSWDFKSNDKARKSAFISVDSFDLHSVRLTAERIIRHLLFDQDPSVPTPTDTLFSYEKHIVQMYKEIPEIILEWYADPSKPTCRKRILKLLAYIRQGIPPFWPCVSRQADFINPRGNPLIDHVSTSGDINEIGIGSPRIGLEILWPLDAPQNGGQNAELGNSDESDMVVAAALSKYHRRGGCIACMLEENLSFPEAGPRESVYSSAPENVAIVVSGGIAPGINAVIDGIVRRQKQYSQTTEVLGVNHGFFGMKEWNESFVEKLSDKKTSTQATLGGSCLTTCRLKDLLPGNPGREMALNAAIDSLSDNKIKILYIIGGDGTMRAAHHISQACRQRRKRISVIGIPKTMDNDVFWVWQSFGFATAVEKARETIEHLATEVGANPRICVLQLFGSASGFVVSHAVLASRAGTCDFALIPEAEFTIDKLAWKLAVKIAKEKRTIPYGLIVMAESAIPSAEACKQYMSLVPLAPEESKAMDEYLAYRKNHDGRFPDGQISNDLRSAGLKLVSEGLRIRLIEIFNDAKLRDKLRHEVNNLDLPTVFVNDNERFRVFANEPRHLLRSVPPSFSDVIMGNRLGALAVDNAMAGYTGFMISQWLTEYVMVPLDLVALGRKHIPQEGIFWKSVLAKTGQGTLV